MTAEMFGNDKTTWWNPSETVEVLNIFKVSVPRKHISVALHTKYIYRDKPSLTLDF